MKLKITPPRRCDCAVARKLVSRHLSCGISDNHLRVSRRRRSNQRGGIEPIGKVGRRAGEGRGNR